MLSVYLLPRAGRVWLHLPQRSGTQDETFKIQTFHQHLDAPVNFTQDVLFGHEDIIKNKLACVGATHTQLVKLLRARESVKGRFHHERGNTFRSFLWLCLGVYDDVVCIGALDIALACG